jgi:hypothetical protein
MKTRLVILGTVTGALGVALAVALTVVPSSVGQEPPPPIAPEPLTAMSEFTDDVSAQFRFKLDGQGTTVVNVKDASRTMVVKFTVQPGARFPWHTHPGPVVVNIVESTLTLVNADDCVERPYGPGTAFVDPGHGNVHTAFNGTAVPVVFYATFFEVPEGGPFTIPVDPPAGCQVEVEAHGH